jgi:hypothetical protein
MLLKNKGGGIMNWIKDRWNKFLTWIEKASKKEPPKCGGGCCK